MERIKLKPIKTCTTLITTGRFLGKVQTYRGGVKSGTLSVEQETPPRDSETARRRIGLVREIRTRGDKHDGLVKLAHRILLSGNASLGKNLGLQKTLPLPINNLSILASKKPAISTPKKGQTKHQLLSLNTTNKRPIFQRSKDQILSAQITFKKETLKHNSINPIKAESQPIITNRYLRSNPVSKNRFKLTPPNCVTQVTMASKPVLKYA